jgi:uncharacterized protein
MDLFWEIDGWERADRHLSALEKLPFQRALPAIELTPGVTLIRGPRQIGKSTWLKKLLKETIASRQSCFFYSCEDLSDYKELTELLKSISPRQFIFLDEVTYVSEWWRAIKKIVDQDQHIHFVLTGSNSYDLKSGADLMPGRWSKGAGELHLLPMLFDEWCAMRAMAGWQELSTLELLRQYMRIGGFPTALIEAGPTGGRPVEAIAVYQRWLMGDVVKLKRQELFMKELLLQVAKTIGNPVSLQNLATKTQLMSYHTVQDYLSILEHAYALRTIFAYDPETDSFRFKKDKKYFFTDPIVYWAAFDFVGVSPPDDFEAALAEQIAAEHLSRNFKRLGYFSNRNGEIDFVSGANMAVEVKWAPVARNLSKAYLNLNIANKTVWTQSNFFAGLDRLRGR